LALLTADQLNALARHGAQARINELQQEIAAIEREFPGLRSKRRERPRKQATQAADANGSPKLLPSGAVAGGGQRRRARLPQRG
jgi:hypothetical protein